MEIRVARPRPGAGAVRGRRCARPATTSSSRSGLCRTEGLVESAADDSTTIAYCLGRASRSAEQQYNIVTVRLAPTGRPRRPRARGTSRTRRAASAARPRSTRSRCAARRSAPGPTVAASVLGALPERARARASACSTQTGGLHAAARFTPDGDAASPLREDVGRHNALDKLIGHALLDGALPLADAGAARLGSAVVRARAEGRGRGHPGAVRGVGAVEPRGRGGRAVRPDASSASCATAAFNVYTHPERIDLASA